MEYSQYAQDFVVHNEEYAISPKFFEADDSHLAANFSVSVWMGGRVHQASDDLNRELLPKFRPLAFVPGNRFDKLRLGCSLENEIQGRFQPNFFSIFRATSGHGTPLPGFASNSASRRSSSAACSGDNSASCSVSLPNSRQICATRSRCSISGKRRISSRISALLMRIIYPFKRYPQGCLWTQNSASPA